MNTLLSEDQAELETFCQKLLENEWPLEKALKTLGANGSGHSAELWATLAEAGWLGLPFSSAYGGADGTLVDLGTAYRAAGSRLVPSTLYSCIFAELLIDRIGTEAQKQALLPPIIKGDALATVAYSEPQAAEDTRLFTTTAARLSDGWVLNGVKAFVPNVDTAAHVIILANVHDNGERGQQGLFVVERTLLDAATTPATALGGEALFKLTLDKLKVPADALLGGDAALADTPAKFKDVVETATALQCMEMSGGAGELMRWTIDYVTERKQGGKPIGANQAVQHMLANVSMALDGARVAAAQALFLKDAGRPAGRELAIAKIACGSAYVDASTTAHQLWGSMGYARETGLFLWSERAKVTDAWYGPRTTHVRRLAEHMGL